mgnify:CR=1 FL=1
MIIIIRHRNPGSCRIENFTRFAKVWCAAHAQRVSDPHWVSQSRGCGSHPNFTFTIAFASSGMLTRFPTMSLHTQVMSVCCMANISLALCALLVRILAPAARGQDAAEDEYQQLLQAGRRQLLGTKYLATVSGATAPPPPPLGNSRF